MHHHAPADIDEPVLQLSSVLVLYCKCWLQLDNVEYQLMSGKLLRKQLQLFIVNHKILAMSQLLCYIAIDSQLCVVYVIAIFCTCGQLDIQLQLVSQLTYEPSAFKMSIKLINQLAINLRSVYVYLADHRLQFLWLNSRLQVALDQRQGQGQGKGRVRPKF